MNGPAYYNDNDPFAAAWLRGLVRDGLIAPGEVDQRCITKVRPSDLKGFAQCHFCAGIGGWSYALRLARWADDRPVWTASLPCQPLSGAGYRRGHADSRHLWPAFHHLVAERSPPIIFGEQVASADGREWLAGIRADLEGMGYACGAADLCAAGVGAPNIRQRLFWLAYSDSVGFDSRGSFVFPRAVAEAPRGGSSVEPGRCGNSGGMADRVGARLEGHAGDVDERGEPGWINANGPRSVAARGPSFDAGIGRPTVTIQCADGKARRVPADERGEIEPRLFPLANGFSGGRMVVRRPGEEPSQQEAHWYDRKGSLRGAGNAINPILGAQFIRACREVIEEQ